MCAPCESSHYLEVSPPGGKCPSEHFVKEGVVRVELQRLLMAWWWNGGVTRGSLVCNTCPKRLVNQPIREIVVQHGGAVTRQRTPELLRLDQRWQTRGAIVREMLRVHAGETAAPQQIARFWRDEPNRSTFPPHKKGADGSEGGGGGPGREQHYSSQTSLYKRPIA